MRYGEVEAYEDRRAERPAAGPDRTTVHTVHTVATGCSVVGDIVEELTLGTTVVITQTIALRFATVSGPGREPFLHGDCVTVPYSVAVGLE